MVKNITDFLFGDKWEPNSKTFGALPMIAGSFIVTILSAIIATPIAIGAAVFMTENFSKAWCKNFTTCYRTFGRYSISSLWFHWSPGCCTICTFYFGGTGFGILSGFVFSLL